MKNMMGQAALIVLLITAAALTLGLATSKKVVIDTKIDKDEEMLKQAFNAAESGIEKYLGTGANTYLSTDNRSSANVSTTTIGESTTVTYEGNINVNKPAVFWMAAHNPDKTVDLTNSRFSGTSIDICASSTTGSLRVYYYYKDAAGFKVKRWMYNLSATAVTNEITNATRRVIPLDPANCPDGLTLVDDMETETSLSIYPIMVVIVPVVTPTKLAVVSDTPFPAQGELISSRGTVGAVDQQAGASRTINLENRYDGGLLEYMLDNLKSTQEISNQ